MSGFRKSERLRGKKNISVLFEKGRIIQTDNIRTLWILRQNFPDIPARIAIAVPKKNIKKAVSRNTVKRRIKEIYRKHKQKLYNDLLLAEKSIDFIMLYKAESIMKSSDIEPEIILTLQGLIEESTGSEGRKNK